MILWNCKLLFAYTCKNLKKKHKVGKYKVRRKINHRKLITFFGDINMYFNQGKIGIDISVVITVRMKKVYNASEIYITCVYFVSACECLQSVASHQ